MWSSFCSALHETRRKRKIFVQCSDKSQKHNNLYILSFIITLVLQKLRMIKGETVPKRKCDATRRNRQADLRTPTQGNTSDPKESFIPVPHQSFTPYHVTAAWQYMEDSQLVRRTRDVIRHNIPCCRGKRDVSIKSLLGEVAVPPRVTATSCH